MRYTKPIDEIIKARCSIRSYSKHKRLEPRLVAELNQAAATLQKSPWDEAAEFRILATDTADQKMPIGTYGAIADPPAFLTGKIAESKTCYESYGYLFEQLILKATDLGLGTCWLGFYSDEGLSTELNVKANELIPAVSPVGYKNEAVLNRDNILKLARIHKRKPFSELFFAGNLETPLKEEDAGKYHEVLEMVRLAPSAGNLQPWKIVAAAKAFHFFLDVSGSNKGYNEKKLQNIDIGIALCHFELTGMKLGIKGQWQKLDKPPLPVSSRLKYIVTFYER